MARFSGGSAGGVSTGILHPTSTSKLWARTVNNITYNANLQPEFLFPDFIADGTLVNQTSIDNGNTDDGFWIEDLPFDIIFNGTSYSKVFVGTNSYITFEQGSTKYNGFHADTIDTDKIMFFPADHSSNKIYVINTENSFGIRYEGYEGNGLDGDPITWEFMVYSENRSNIYIRVLDVPANVLGAPDNYLIGPFSANAGLLPGESRITSFFLNPDNFLIYPDSSNTSYVDLKVYDNNDENWLTVGRDSSDDMEYTNSETIFIEPYMLNSPVTIYNDTQYDIYLRNQDYLAFPIGGKVYITTINSRFMLHHEANVVIYAEGNGITSGEWYTAIATTAVYTLTKINPQAWILSGPDLSLD